MERFLRAKHLSGCIGPRQGRQKLSKVLAESTFPKIWEKFTLTNQVLPEVRKVGKSSIQRTILENGSLLPRPCPRSFSGCRIFLDLSLSESETTHRNLHPGRFSCKSDLRSARYLHFCENMFGKSTYHFRCDLPRCCSIKLVARSKLSTFVTAGVTRKAFSCSINVSV